MKLLHPDVATRLLAIVDPGCLASTRYRVKQFEGHLQRNGVRLEILECPPHRINQAKLLDRMAQADVVLFQRYLPDPATIRGIRRRARRLIYDFDDAVVYSESTRGKPRLRLRRAWRFRQMMRCCDAVTAGNSYLSALARRYAPADRVHVVPTALELDRYSGTASISGQVIGPVIGWIGSRSTLPYLESLRRPFEWLSQEVQGLTVRVIADQCPNLGKTPVEWVPWEPHTEVRELQRLRVGLAPLPDDPWTRGKCGLRLLQYLAAGIPAVASPVGTQAEIIAHGAALPATSDADWIGGVQRILAEADLARTLIDCGRKLVRERFDAPALAGSVQKIWCGTT